MIVLDVETTGLDPKNNSLVAIGALDFDNPEDRFYEECKIWEGAEVEEAALAVNGYTQEEIRDKGKMDEAEIVIHFFQWLKNKDNITIAGQNVHLDLYFIEAAARRANIKDRLPHRTFEQHSIVMFHMIKKGITPPTNKRKSALGADAIMEYVGIPNEPKPHVAINGAIWEYEALHRLIHDKPSLEEFKKYPIPWI